MEILLETNEQRETCEASAGNGHANALIPRNPGEERARTRWLVIQNGVMDHKVSVCYLESPAGRMSSS